MKTLVAILLLCCVSSTFAGERMFPGPKLTQPVKAKPVKITTDVWEGRDGQFAAIVITNGKERVVGKAKSYERAKSMASQAASRQRDRLKR